MDLKKYNNILACRRYYERNRCNPEFRLRKAMQQRKYACKKRKPFFWELFQRWKHLSVTIQPVVKIKQIKTTINSQLKCFILKRKRLLLKAMMQSWKDYERTPKPAYNPNCKPIVCSFF